MCVNVYKTLFVSVSIVGISADVAQLVRATAGVRDFVGVLLI